MGARTAVRTEHLPNRARNQPFDVLESLTVLLGTARPHHAPSSQMTHTDTEVTQSERPSKTRFQNARIFQGQRKLQEAEIQIRRAVELEPQKAKHHGYFS